MYPKHTQPAGSQERIRTVVDAPWALVPMKSLERAKGRLAPVLGPLRRGLSVAMFSDVSACLLASRAIAKVAVVTRDREIIGLAAPLGIVVVNETGTGMNEALRQGAEAIREMGATRVVIVPADVPLITAAEIDRVLDELRAAIQDDRDPVIGILASRNRDGTNLLGAPLPLPFDLAYGPGSFDRHRQAARAAGATVLELSAPGIALDVDEAEDLEALLATCRSQVACQRTETWKYLRAQGIDRPPRTAQRVINQ